MAAQFTIKLKSRSKGFHLVTDELLCQIPKLPEVGMMHLFIQHTSAALAVNENADPSVRRDLEKAFEELAPESPKYEHADEGPDDMPAHIKSVLLGSSVTIPITNGRLNLGTWQGVYLCEFRTQAPVRTVIVTVL